MRSPDKARSMAFCVKAVAWPSRRDSTANVVLLREPLGRPFGFPDCPGRKGFNCFGTVLTVALRIRAPVILSQSPFLVDATSVGNAR
jgi:hypothetical protein